MSGGRSSAGREDPPAVIDESGEGLPEEAPPGADPSGPGGRSDRTPAARDADEAPDNDDGKATGNPHSAG